MGRGETLPYHLRPHKAVDRRIFIDLLGRFERWRPLHDYAYISMGAYPMEDHRLVHRHFGLKRLISFDLEEEVVSRQKFNRPIASCVCLCKASGDVVSNLQDVLNEGNAEDAAGVIIWLDYTNPQMLGEQIREFQELIDGAAPNDVVRVTVNANPSSLGEAEAGLDGRKPTAEDTRRARFAALRERIDEYLPSDAGPEKVTSKEYPGLLARAFGNAAAEAFPPSDTNEFLPISIVSYADGQQMVSITGVILDKTETPVFMSKLGLKEWPFLVSGWSQIHHLEVPDLTYRERLFFEQKMNETSPGELRDEMGFALGKGNGEEFIRNYLKYYRFYPSLFVAEV